MLTPSPFTEKEGEPIIYPDPDTEPILTEQPQLRHPPMMNNLFGTEGGGEFPAMGDENMAHIMQSLLANLGSAQGGGGMAGSPQEPQVEVPDNLIVKLIRTRIPIAIIAVCVFFMFHTGAGHLLSNNVLLSLLLWEVVELFLLRLFNKLNQKRSKITFVLALFNVPPHLVDRCLTMLGMFNKVVQDFSVFMFIFCFLHYAFNNDRGEGKLN